MFTEKLKMIEEKKEFVWIISWQIYKFIIISLVLII